ncbi:hypothetical protein GCM10022206_59280 [Streptomyces chiangmaiensis]
MQACRRELLDRTLIWDQRHLLYALREFESFYNEHRRIRASRTPALSVRYPLRSVIQSGSRASTYDDARDSAAP